MILPDYLLDLPAEEAARLIALTQLERVADAARRLADPTDPTALHDFRVATRRLRSSLQAYRTEIDGSAPRRLRRRLARLDRATRRSRNAEVYLTWERQQAANLSERQRPGLAWHLALLETRRRRADRRLARLVARRFGPLERALRRRLERYRLRIERDPARRRHEAAAVLGSRIRQLGGDLESRLAAVRTPADPARARRAWLAAKRLRYLLEPIEREADGVAPVVARLRALQQLLGELHDSRRHRRELERRLEAARREHARGLAAALRASAAGRPVPDAGDDPRPGLLALMRRLEDRETSAFRQLDAEWLGGAADELFAAVGEIGKRIANRPACVAEVERRFLLRQVPATARPFALAEIDQGWLPGTRLVERTRPLGEPRPVTYRSTKLVTAGSDGAPAGQVDAALFEEIWPLTAGRRLWKRRYVVRDYGLEWEIDQFLDRELVLAEVAMQGREESTPIPEWLAPYVLREVTGEPAFGDRALAR